jgi:hypothetical protein
VVAVQIEHTPRDGADVGSLRPADDASIGAVRSPPKDTITQLAVCLARRADRYRPGEFAIHKSDDAPDEKERRPKYEPPGYQSCIMRGEMWPRRQETFPA